MPCAESRRMLLNLVHISLSGRSIVAPLLVSGIARAALRGSAAARAAARAGAFHQLSRSWRSGAPLIGGQCPISSAPAPWRGEPLPPVRGRARAADTGADRYRELEAARRAGRDAVAALVPRLPESGDHGRGRSPSDDPGERAVIGNAWISPAPRAAAGSPEPAAGGL